jgi:hypothetical protein
VTNTLAYYGMELIVAVKFLRGVNVKMIFSFFVADAHVANVKKAFY